MVMGVAIGEDDRLVTTCCVSNGGLGDSLLVVELKVFILTVNITAANIVTDKKVINFSFD